MERNLIRDIHVFFNDVFNAVSEESGSGIFGPTVNNYMNLFVIMEVTNALKLNEEEAVRLSGYMGSFIAGLAEDE